MYATQKSNIQDLKRLRTFKDAKVALVHGRKGSALVVKVELDLAHGAVAVLFYQNFCDVSALAVGCGRPRWWPRGLK